MTENDSRVIIETYIKRIFGFMSNRVSNYEDVNDLTQDVCIKIYEAILRGKEISNLEHYIWTIAHNVLSNYYRDNSKYKMQTDISKYSETMSDDRSGALDKIIKDENEERLRKEIAYLSKSQRQVVIMHYYEGRKQSEIAEMLNIPVGTVKWYLSRAKEELKKGMERKLYELPNMFNAGKELYPDDMALLVEKGFVKREEDGRFSCATIKINAEIENELIRIGNECRKNVEDKMAGLRNQVQNLMLEGVPAHLKEMAEYNNQSIFNSEGIFIWYIGDYMVKSGKLQLPNEEQKRSACIVQVEY